MENSTIYGEALPLLEETKDYILCEISRIRAEMKAEHGIDPVEHCLARIKGDDSMREKCRRKGLPETAESALVDIHDAVGIRIVCSFIKDVYSIKENLKKLPDIEVVEEKDYITHAKQNGYRSYHMIMKHKDRIYAEIQIRTISMDTWAALEHDLKYKKEVGSKQTLIEKELKRCASELASTDLSMQTLREMILGY